MKRTCGSFLSLPCSLLACGTGERERDGGTTKVGQTQHSPCQLGKRKHSFPPTAANHLTRVKPGSPLPLDDIRAMGAPAANGL